MFKKLVLDKVRSFPTLGEAATFFEVDTETLDVWLSGHDLPVSALEKVFDPTKLLGDSLWEGRKVGLMFPWYKSTNPATSFSIMSILDRQKMQVFLQFGDAFIVHTRNKLAESFLRSDCEWALTVDDDMILPCGKADWFNSFTGFNLPEKFAGMHTVNRLMSHGKTLVGALYYGRWAKGKPVYGECNDPNEERWARSGPHDMCKPTRWVGTGCMLIHRSVFLDIEKTFPHLARDAEGNRGNWFTSSEHDLKEASRSALEVLNDVGVTPEVRVREAARLIEESSHRAKVHSSLGMGEDVQFCIRAKQAGHQPHVDMGLVCGHMGNMIFGPKHVGFVKPS